MPQALVAVHMAVFIAASTIFSGCSMAVFIAVGTTFELAVQNVINTVTGEEKIVSDEIAEAERYLEGIEKQYGSQLPQWLNWGPFKALFGSGSGNYGAAK